MGLYSRKINIKCGSDSAWGAWGHRTQSADPDSDSGYDCYRQASSLGTRAHIGGQGSTAPMYKLPKGTSTFYYMELALEAKLQRKVNALKDILDRSKGQIQ